MKTLNSLFPPIEVTKQGKKVASVSALVYIPIIFAYTGLAGLGLGALIKRVMK